MSSSSPPSSRLQSRSWLQLLLGLVAAARLAPAEASYSPPAKYLIVSNAMNGTISYVQVPEAGSFPRLQPLIERGLGHPQGIAVDQKRRLLLVADSELKKVVSYGLSIRSDGTLAVDEQTPVAENVEARWVAVDGPGNVYLTDEPGNRVMKVSAQQVLNGETTPEVVLPSPLSADSRSEGVSAPGGIATDNFYLYWANKLEGRQFGSVVRALGVSGPNSSLPEVSIAQPLAKNSPKIYGLCLGLDTIYYTDAGSNVYAVGRSGGEVRTITTSLSAPRGCVWDGDATVYVADRSAGAIFAFHAAQGGQSLAEVAVRKAADSPEAFGLALFSGGRHCGVGGSSGAPASASTSLAWLLPLLLVTSPLAALPFSP